MFYAPLKKKKKAIFLFRINILHLKLTNRNYIYLNMEYNYITIFLSNILITIFAISRLYIVKNPKRVVK